MAAVVAPSVELRRSTLRRNGAGRFASTHAATVLLDAVPDVARNVARKLGKAPEAVTQREWNTGRRAVRVRQRFLNAVRCDGRIVAQLYRWVLERCPPDGSKDMASRAIWTRSRQKDGGLKTATRLLLSRQRE